MRSMKSDFDPDNHIDWSVIKQIVPYLLEYKLRIVLALVCLVAAKLASIGMPFLLKEVVDTLDQSINTAEKLLVGVPLALLLAYGIARFLNSLLGEIRDTLFGRVTERAMRRIGLRVFEHLHALDLAFHLNRQTGGLSRDIERGTGGVSFLMRFMVFNIIPTFLELLLVIGIFASQYRYEFALIVSISVVVYIWFSKATTDWRTQFIREANQADNRSNTRAIDSLLNFETVKYFANESYEAALYDKELAAWEVARRKNRLTLFVLNAGQALIIAAALTAMLLLAALEVSEGRMSLGDFVLVNAFMMQIFMPLNFLGFVYREIKSALTNIEKMFDLLKTDSKLKDHQDAESLDVKQGEVTFSHVSFAYEPSRKIIEDFTLTIPAGKKVAIVGASGSGKSTLGKLLFRLYDVQQGDISIDRQSVSKVTQHSLRSAIGVVPQDAVLFNASLIENVRYAKPNATDEEVKHAFHLAHLEAFVASLPNGYNTMVGERGLKLSGGEKQRVAIARTILKNPSILIFDEATSSLDSRSERVVMDAIRDVSAGKTSIVIAHRLSTIIDADLIVVMEKGQIVEQGTHQALMEKNGSYAQLWQMQESTLTKIVSE